VPEAKQSSSDEAAMVHLSDGFLGNRERRLKIRRGRQRLAACAFGGGPTGGSLQRNLAISTVKVVFLDLT
jgi:hypothetical protein